MKRCGLDFNGETSHFAGVQVLCLKARLACLNARRWATGVGLLPALLVAVMPLKLAAGMPLSTTSVSSIEQIREITPDQADQRSPVRVRGVVTFSDWDADRGLFLQDNTAGIYIGLDLVPGDWSIGTEIEVQGTTSAGDYVPYVTAHQIRKIADVPLPTAPLLSYDELASGKEDSQWVQVRGVVRSVIASTKNRTRVDLMVDGERLTALVGGMDLTNAQSLICSTVRAYGVCRTRYNRKRQLRAPFLSMSSSNYIIVEKPPPGPPIEVPMASLLQFNSEGYYGRRVEVRGVVTEQKGSSLFLQDKGGTLYVKSEQSTPVLPGDIVKVTGFPGLGQYAPELEDAVYQVVGHQAPPPPVNVSIEQLLTEGYDLVLVRLRGRLLNRVDRFDEQVLVLESENLILSAHLDSSKVDERLSELKNGSELELTGVCLSQPVENWNPSLPTHPEAFELLLRSPADVVVLHQPPWWTLARLCWVLGLLSVAVLGGFGWIFILDRRVRHQTEIIQQKAQREAVLEERTRIAREFHDTLEQELAAITIQLDTVSAQFDDAPNVARQLLELARTMSRRSLFEARRSVWDLRSHLLENSSLLNAITEVTKIMSSSGGVRIEIETTGRPHKLAAPVENNLLRIAQEALANALKHARASHIVVKLNYEADRVRLRICDDGAGFDTTCHATIYGGHFGLLDMSERAGKIGGTFSMVSAVGQGTEIIVTVADKGVPDAATEPQTAPEEKVPAA